MRYLCSSIAALLSSTLIQVIGCAPAISPLPSRPIYSLPPLQPSIPLNASSNGNCASTARYPSWTSNDWVIEDCYTAVQQLYFKEFLVHPDVAYEFVAPGVSPTKPPQISQRTPRKYIFSKSISRFGMLSLLILEVEKGLKFGRKLCPNDYDAGLVPCRPTTGGCQIQQGADGREHLSRYLGCGKKYRDRMHRVQITGLAYDR